MHSETHCKTVLQDRGISTAIASAPMLLEIALLRTCRAPCWPTCNTAAMPDRKAVSRQHCCVRRLRPPPGAAAAAGPIGTRSARSANSLCIVRDQLPKRFCFFQAPIHPSALGKALKLHKLSLCRPANYNIRPKLRQPSSTLSAVDSKSCIQIVQLNHCDHHRRSHISTKSAHKYKVRAARSCLFNVRFLRSLSTVRKSLSNNRDYSAFNLSISIDTARI